MNAICKRMLVNLITDLTVIWAEDSKVTFQYLVHRFVCMFVTEATHLSVKTGSERGSYANTYAVAASSSAHNKIFHAVLN